MQAASQRPPAWADLQPELLLHVAGLLGNEDRWGSGQGPREAPGIVATQQRGLGGCRRGPPPPLHRRRV